MPSEAVSGSAALEATKREDTRAHEDDVWEDEEEYPNSSKVEEDVPVVTDTEGSPAMGAAAGMTDRSSTATARIHAGQARERCSTAKTESEPAWESLAPASASSTGHPHLPPSPGRTPSHRRHPSLSSTPRARPSPSPVAEMHTRKAPSPAPESAPLWERCGHALYTVFVLLGLSAPPDFAQTDDALPRRRTHPARHVAVMSLWDHLLDEVLSSSSESTQELKWERVSNFMAVPIWVEKLVTLGLLVCFNSFLYTLTILPLRFLVAWTRWAYNAFEWVRAGRKRYLNVSNKCDILQGLLVIQTCYLLSRIADASKMYHSVRGQDVVKLSVIFSVLEISDRLCASFGQDVLDSLFSRYTLARRSNGSQPYVRMLGYYVLSLAYIVFHTFVLLYELVTLNVAINSYDNALLTLLLSNQFVEIKTTVFKRFEKENLFQLTCADIVERFQLSVLLVAIGARNLIEVAGASSMSGGGTLGPLPTSFDVYPYVNVVFRTLNPVLTVLLSEVLVDWLKHAFITKQNHIRPAVYGRYMDVLCRDLLPSPTATAMDGHVQRQSSLVDQTPLVTRRLGLAVLPLVCVTVRLAFQIVDMLLPSKDELALVTTQRVLDQVVFGATVCLVVVATWIVFIVLKILLGVRLVNFATNRYASRHEREREDQRNARGRPPIGEMPAQAAYEAQITQMVDKKEDDAASVDLYGHPTVPGRASKKEVNLLDVQRYTLVGSRLW
ncbi:hypothetical protein MEQU1_003616 [Malassezia equina]|uniref:Endoplasmic reticulum membrane protein 65 n=1 Tax=Malassezia equina TaxID=1381935 RepID=A0AAF0J5E3_9BASI|nr:hypothetical protein MEQU1_003616 [Malassezia equina]